MAKRQAEPLEYVAETLRALGNPGLLLASLDARGKPNVMTIGWGSLGIFWGRPVFIVPVRRSRYTYGCINKTGDFTVNVLPRTLAKLAAFCGSRSGRDHDKFAEAGLTAAPGKRVKSPIIQECVLNYECKVAHANDLLPKAMQDEILRSAYRSGDYHRFFFGEILAVRAEPSLRRRL
jgi:flavin reductase (DIM6/NTAB) family NADH-FMN oxidoreductase RutF